MNLKQEITEGIDAGLTLPMPVTISLCCKNGQDTEDGHDEKGYEIEEGVN